VYIYDAVASKVKKMWRLKIGDGGKNPYIFSTNNFVGRQIWEFDSEAGTDEERAQVEAARQDFYQNRFKLKACGDRLWRFQVLLLYYLNQNLILQEQKHKVSHYLIILKL